MRGTLHAATDTRRYTKMQRRRMVFVASACPPVDWRSVDRFAFRETRCVGRPSIHVLDLASRSERRAGMSRSS